MVKVDAIDNRPAERPGGPFRYNETGCISVGCEGSYRFGCCNNRISGSGQRAEHLADALREKAEYEFVRRILKLTFQYRDALYGLRHPAMWNYEMPDPPKEEADRINESQRNFYGMSKAGENRWQKVAEIREALYPELLEVEALWGRQLHDLFKVLFDLQHELLICIRHYLELINPDTPRADREAIEEIRKKGRDIRCDSLNGNDEFRKDFSGGMQGIEKLPKRYQSH
jgi:hypothetical protein